MKLQETLKNIILQGGGTLDKNLQLKTFHTGYMVALKDFEDGYKLDTPIEELDENIRYYQSHVVGHDSLIGLWITNGYIYIDKVVLITSKFRALMVASVNNQYSIWDNKNSIEIKTEEN